MKKLIKNIAKSQVVKLAFLLFLLVFIFGQIARNSLFVTASNEKVDVYPQSFSKESNFYYFKDISLNPNSDEFLWNKVENVFSKELEFTDDILKFNGENSAILILGNYEKEVISSEEEREDETEEEEQEQETEENDGNVDSQDDSDSDDEDIEDENEVDDEAIQDETEELIDNENEKEESDESEEETQDPSIELEQEEESSVEEVESEIIENNETSLFNLKDSIFNNLRLAKAGLKQMFRGFSSLKFARAIEEGTSSLEVLENFIDESLEEESSVSFSQQDLEQIEQDEEEIMESFDSASFDSAQDGQDREDEQEKADSVQDSLTQGTPQAGQASEEELAEEKFDSASSTEENISENDNEDDNLESQNPEILKDSLIFSDFYFDDDLSSSEISNVQLRMSLAVEGDFQEDQIVIEYTMGNDWIEVGTFVSLEDDSNLLNEGYFLYAMPIFSSWEDIRDLKIRLSYENDLNSEELEGAGVNIYLDSLWLEIDYSQKDDSKEITKERVIDEEEHLFFEEDTLEDKGKIIDFSYTDDNSGENLIIKTNSSNYFGLTESEVYFSVTNITDEEESFGLQIYFPNDVGDVESIEKLKRITQKKEVPEYGNNYLYCADKWFKEYSSTTTNNYLCRGTQVRETCFEVVDGKTGCNQKDVYIGTTTRFDIIDDWKSAKILNKKLDDNRNIFEKVLGLGPKKKRVSDDFEVKKSTEEGAYTIFPGETQFFKMEISFPFLTEGEFYIETIGENFGYGLLDPWWNANWDYEREIDITYTGVALTNHQVKLEIDTATLISGGKMQADCDDIRFLDTAKGQNDELDYFLEPESCNDATTTLWIKVPSITANKTIYMYYGNTSATAGSDGSDTFVYFKDFEVTVGFNEGNLNPARSTQSDRFGTYGIEANGSTNYRQEWRNGLTSGRDLVWETWIREDSASASTSLAGIVVGHPNGGANNAGYQAIIRTNNPYLEIREDYTTTLCSDTSPSISADTWYFLQFIWESDDSLTASLYVNATTSSAILTCNTSDSTYTNGEYGVAGYQQSDWDNYRIRKYATTTPTLVASTETNFTSHYPTDPASLVQYKISTSTILANGAWTEYSQVNFYASSTDKDGDGVSLYYQLIGSDDNFITTTTRPTSTPCLTNTNYNDCVSKLWTNDSSLVSNDDDAWYNNGWGYRQKITIEQEYVVSTESNFVVLITSTTDSNLASKARSDGYDIVFTDSTGTTTLDFEREYYNSSSGEFVFWVEMDVSSATDTEIYMYYGNATQSSDLSNGDNVWDSDYLGVWHMSEDPTGTIFDSTSNSNDMVSAGGMSSGDLVDGQIGESLYFDGDGDYITDASPSGYTASQQNWTMSAWFVDDAQPNEWANFYAHITAGPTAYDPQWVLNDSTITIVDGGTGYTGNDVAEDGEWHKIDFVRTGTAIAFYIDGVAAGTDSGYSDLLPVPISIYIGNSGAGEVEEWTGELDEIRYSETNRSLAWLQTEFNNQDSPTTFLTFSSEEASVSSWYSSDWTYRKKITIESDQVVSNESDFSAMIATSSDSDLSSYARSDGYDIIFTHSNGVSALGFERTTFNPTTGEVIFWVNIPEIYSATDTEIYMYYGNASQSTDLSSSTAWNDNYIMVHHLEETSGTHYDSTSNDNDSDTVTVTNQDAVGIIGSADEFVGDGGNDEIDIGASASFNAMTYLTASIWAYTDDNTDDNQTPFSFYQGTFERAYMHYDSGVNGMDIYNNIDNAGNFTAITNFTPTNGVWFNYVWIIDGSNFRTFINGLEVGTIEGDTQTMAGMPDGIIASIGRRAAQTGYEWDGVIDEVFISDVVRSDGWIETSYNNINASSTFTRFGSGETNSGSGDGGGDIVINVLNIPDSTIGYKWQVLACDTNDNCSYWTPYNASTPNFKVDTGAPTTPGSLTLNTALTTQVILNFGATSTDGNFDEYKIFYKAGSSGVTETDTLFGSSSDANLATTTFNGAATTTIAGLSAGTQYVFNIWAYDSLGNKSSGTTELVITTKYLPSNPASMTQQKSDGSTNIPNEGWTNENQVKLYGSSSDGSGANMAIFYELLVDSGTFTTEKTAPTNACKSGTNFADCTDGIWVNSTSDWYDYKWKYRKKITIESDYVTVDTIDFPVLITSSTNSHLASNARSDGYDIVFTDSSGTTTIAFEREEYDSSTGEINYWVNIPSISSSVDTDVYMYYGNADQSTDLATTTGVWDSDYVAVWHMGEIDANDSTSNNNNCTEYNGVTNTSESMAGNANYFAGTSDYLNCGNAATLQLTGDLTVEAWAKNLSGDAYRGILGKAETNGYALVNHLDDDFVFWVGTGGYTDTRSNLDTYTDTDWHHIVGVRSGGTSYLYVDGALQTDTDTPTLTDSGDYFAIGRQYTDVSDRWWLGSIDEVRVSSDNRSTAWISTQYNNLNSPSTFLVFDTTTARNSIVSDSKVSIINILSSWYHPNWSYRRKITFGTNHDILPLGYTATTTMDTRPATTNVSLTSGNDVRIVWESSSGIITEIDRIGDTWNDANTIIEFKLQSAIPANADEDTDGSYYIYYGNTGAGTPPTDKEDVYKVWDDFDDASIDAMWATVDNDGIGGTAFSEASGQLTIDAGGADIWDDPFFADYDEYAAVYIDSVISGDFEAILKIDEQENTDAWAKTGIMVRDDISAAVSVNSGYSVTGITQSNGYLFGYDSTDNGYINVDNSPGSASPPDCVRVEKVGTTFTGSYSTDCTSYTDIASQGLASAETIQDVGIFNTSHSASINTSKYDYFQLKLTVSNPEETSLGSEEGPESVLDEYKWQVIACNMQDICSAWTPFNVTTPNFKIDTQPPTQPGALTVLATTTTSVELQFGATTTEVNFSQYKIYYKIGTGEVTESHTLFGSSSDNDLSNILFNGTATTSIDTLTAGQTYTMAIFAYDQAGNVASSTTITFETGAADNPPTGIFNLPITQDTNGSGIINLSITADDADNEDTVRTKLEYVSGASCDFSSPLDPTLDDTVSNIGETYGEVRINNSNTYQIGYTDYWIWTSPGANTVTFDWLSKSELDGQVGTYCLRLTANDSINDQTTPATTTIYIDNADPTGLGNLTENDKTAYTAILNFGNQASDDNFSEYKIFYKVGSSGVEEGDSEWNSGNDSNLASSTYGGASTTTVTGLLSNTQYVFNIWAYDIYGNVASAIEMTVTTKNAPTTPGARFQYKSNGTTEIANQGWTNENEVILAATTTDFDESGNLDFYFNLATTSGTFVSTTTPPASYCASTTAFASCGSKIWYTQVASSSGNYSATVNPTSVPDDAAGYKWRVMACDSEDNCSAWTAFNATTPNFKVDTIAPTIPGWLIEYETMATSATVTLGTTTSDTNFSQYKIFYKVGASGVTESDTLHGSSTDSNLASSTYAGATTTQIIDLIVGTQYVLNIWAYDEAGNKASSTQELTITTEVTNNAPTGVINSITQKTDASGGIDISITADDADNNDTLMAKIEFVAGVTCDFTTPLDPTLDETPANITSSHGDTIVIDDDEIYQVGSSTGRIRTSPGANTVQFDWFSKTDLPTADGTYCLRLTVNDNNDNDQDTPYTQLLTIDNAAPTTPGDLVFSEKSSISITLQMGSVSTDSNFDRYKVYYKAGSSGVTESDSFHDDISFDTEGEFTTVSGLAPSTEYVFNIWAYDAYGNKASATTELVVTTRNVPGDPTGLAQYKADGITTISNGDWTDENQVKIYATSTDADNNNTVVYYELIGNGTSFTQATTVPSNICVTGSTYGGCASKIWSNASTSDSWYSKDWMYRKRIVIDSGQVQSTESNFPVLVSTTDSDLASRAREDGYDIMFTDSTGTTSLSYEREYYSSSTGAFIGWVKVPTISADDDTVLYMYYGKATSTDISTTTGVWDSNYVMVHHLEEDSGTVTDSTGNTDGTVTGANQNYTGIIDGADDFDGDIDYITLANDCLVTENTWTLEMWINGDNPGNYDRAFTQGDSCASRQFMVFYRTDYNALNVRADTGGGDGNSEAATVAISPDTWYHFVWVRNDGANTLYLDGQVSVGTTSVIAMTLDGATYIGARRGSGNNYWDGPIDEVRLSDSVRSATWIETEYNNQSAPDTFMDIQTEESLFVDSQINITSIPDSGTGYKWQALACDADGCSDWTPFDATTTPNFKIDTVTPTAPGQMSMNNRGIDFITLAFGSASTEANFEEYIIYYKAGTSGVTEGDTPITSSTDSDLGYINYNGTSEITISGLESDMDYVFNIWAYDESGKKASSTEVTFKTVFRVTETFDYHIGMSSSGWVNSDNAWDQTNDTYAYRDAPAFSADDSANYLLGTDNTSTSTPQEVLEMIEIGIEGYVEDTDVDLKIVPIFDGTATGSVYTISGTSLGTSDSDADAHVDITLDALAPADWKWPNVNNLDVLIYAYNASSSIARVYVDQVRVRVTVDYFPNNPVNLEQYESDAQTAIINGAFHLEDTVVLYSEATDPDTDESLSLFHEFIPTDQSFTATVTKPVDACVSGVAYGSCTSKVWFINHVGTTTNFSITPFTGTTTITFIPEGNYKWQALACDDDDVCSVSWTDFNASIPNIKVDADAPTGLGALTFNDETSVSIVLNFGNQASDFNFDEYKIFYKADTSGVTEGDTPHTSSTDANLATSTFNGATTTTITGLSPSTDYVFNIWAYDAVGNKASSTEITTSTKATHLLTQSSYLVENDDGVGVNLNTSEVIAGIALTSVEKGQRANIRLQVQNTGGDQTYNIQYKLQFENNTDSPGVWTDVGVATAISRSYGLSGANGNIITGAKAANNTNTWYNGTWHENTNTTGNYNLAKDSYTEFVFVVETSNALVGKDYRLRLIDATASSPFTTYSAYPTLTMVAAETKKYSKEAPGALPGNSNDLTYYLDAEGYDDVLANDGIRDAITSSISYPTFNFVAKHNDTSGHAIDVTWDGQSSQAASARNVYLQAYRFGSTNAWSTIASNATSSADSDFTLSGSVTYPVDEFYDGSGYIYFRVYQNGGNQTLRTDYINISTSTLNEYTGLKHYRWSDDDAPAGTWLEAEDAGSPTVGGYLTKGTNIRLRMSIANLNSGTSTAYAYNLQYATTSVDCSSGVSDTWTDIIALSPAGEHFEMSSSTHFVNGSSTSAKLTNSEGYNFVTGVAVEEPSATTSAITLGEWQYTEIEHVFRATSDADDGGTYCFRAVNDGVALDFYDRYGELTMSGVDNNPPTFTVLPSDGGSATSSPTLNGDDVVFTVTGTDSDGDDYYFALCKSASIAPGNDTSPTCTAGNWCMSSVTTSTEGATCSYTTDLSSESEDWYAYLCDKRAGAGIAQCSTVSQGQAGQATSSPFAINHQPSFDNVYTIVPAQDPGNTFTIQSTSTDTDTSGGADTLYYYVCSTDSATFSGCTATTICSSTGVSSLNPSCDYVDVAPTPAATTTYYAFVYDNHAVVATSGSRSSYYEINNVAAIVGTLVLNGGSDITLNIRGATDLVVSTTNVSVTDQNGCESIVSATAVIYLSSAPDGASCVPDNNNCYQINAGSCVKSACAGADDFTATYECAADLKYYTIPTDNQTNNPWAGDNWLSRMQVYDGVIYTATTSAAVEINTNEALDATETEIAFGVILSGADTGNTNQSVNVINAGNCPLNNFLSGSDLSGVGDSIVVTNIEWELSSGFTWGTGYDLSTIATTVDMILPKPTSTTDIIDLIYWGIGIPVGKKPVDYVGTTTFSATLDTADW